MGTDNELGAFLQARRAVRSPVAAGLPGGGRRRSPGLRREELAALSGVSVDYLVRLEQGRQRDPSPEVLGALAVALGLTADLRRHLFALAGRTDPQPVDPALREVPATLRRLLLAAHPSPAWAINRRRDLVDYNPAAEALLGPLRPGLNYLDLVLGPRARLWTDPEDVLRDAVAGMRMSTAPAHDHPAITTLVQELGASHPEFARVWDEQDVRSACSPVRDVQHDEAGRLGFDVQLLDAVGGDLQLVILDPQEDSRERWDSYLARAGHAGHPLRLA